MAQAAYVTANSGAIVQNGGNAIGTVTTGAASIVSGTGSNGQSVNNAGNGNAFTQTGNALTNNGNGAQSYSPARLSVNLTTTRPQWR